MHCAMTGVGLLCYEVERVSHDFCSDGVCEQRSYCIHNILLFIIVRRPVFNQLVGTGYLIIKRLAFIDLSYRSLSDEFFITIRFTKI